MPLAVTLTKGTALWYLSRGTGVVALLLLTATVILGILESMRWTPPRWSKFSTVLLHRNVSLLALAFIAVHVATIVVDGFAPIGWKDAVIPLASSYRPLWVGLGALALDIQLAVVATSLLRRHVRFGAWKAIHWAAYACWPVALVHGLGTGTDTRVPWMLGLDAACVLSVVVLLLVRLAVGWPRAAAARVFGGVAALGVPLLVAAWLPLGPLHPGWAKKAGTPTSLLASSSLAGVSRQTPRTPSPAPSASGLPPAPFQASLSGTIHQSGSEESGPSTVRIDLVLSGGATGRLRIILRGQPLDGGGVEVSQSQVVLGGPTGGALYEGTVTSLDGPRIGAEVRGPGRPSLGLLVTLALDPSSTQVTGTVSATSLG